MSGWPLRVMTWNVRYETDPEAFLPRLRRIAEVVSHLGPHVLCLQEANPDQVAMLAYTLRSSGFYLAPDMARPDGLLWGDPVFLARAVVRSGRTRIHHLPHARCKRGPHEFGRMVTTVELQRGPQQFILANLHLCPDDQVTEDEHRLRSWKTQLEFADQVLRGLGHPIIVGDMNSAEYALGFLEGLGYEGTRLLGTKHEMQRSHAALQSARHAPAIDFAFAGPGLRLTAAKVDQRTWGSDGALEHASDHWPVLATMEVV